MIMMIIISSSSLTPIGTFTELINRVRILIPSSLRLSELTAPTVVKNVNYQLSVQGVPMMLRKRHDS